MNIKSAIISMKVKMHIGKYALGLKYTEDKNGQSE